MQVFEIHFNPKSKEDMVFDSFCYEPENIYEKKLGNLYIVGELTNVLPQNLKFLENLTKIIKEKFYSLSLSSSEKSLKESLKEANKFLESLIKKENVSWLGNLNFAIFSLKENNLNLTSFSETAFLNFTKVGNLKILLSRSQNLINVGKNLESRDIIKPLKIFSNIVSGKLSQNDKIMIFTKNAFDFFSTENLIQEIISKEILKEKDLKKIFKKYEEKLMEISGIFLLIQVGAKIQPKATLILKEEPLKLKQVFKISLPSFNKISQKLVFFKQLKFIPKIKIPEFFFLKSFIEKYRIKISQAINKLKIIKEELKIFTIRKNLISIVILIFILSAGFFIFNEEKKQKIQQDQEFLNKVEIKIAQAENFLILKDENQANSLLQEAWQELLPRTKINSPLQKESLSLKDLIETKLYFLNKLEKNPSTVLIFEFKPGEIDFIPQKILALNSILYSFNPFSQNFYKFNLNEKTGEVLKINENIKLATLFNNSILFFSEPNILTFLKNGELSENMFQKFSSDSKFNNLVSYRSNIYFLDSDSGEIVKYSLPFNKGNLWLSSQTKKAVKGKSMAIDGNIWILTKNNEIDRYFLNNYQETLKINLFPYLENPAKIATSSSLPYLYILEPAQNRIIILTKQGKIVKQFQSDEFNNLLDFTISENGKTLWLLNNQRVYQLNIY